MGVIVGVTIKQNEDKWWCKFLEILFGFLVNFQLSSELAVKQVINGAATLFAV